VFLDRMRARFGRRAPVLLVLLACAATALSGCGAGPSQAGAAAIVGGRAVSLADVQATVDAGLRQPEVQSLMTAQGVSPADVARFVVSRQVQHLLLAEQAARDGIKVDDDQVSAELAKPSSHALLVNKLAFDPQSARDTMRDELLAEALAARYLDQLTVTLDMVRSTSKDDALVAARQLAAGPAQAKALLAARGVNALPAQQLRAAQQPQNATRFLFGTPAGQIVVVQVAESPDEWLVVRVTNRTTAPPPGGPAASVVPRLDDATKDSIGRRLTQPLADELGVRINPRYGVWDPLTLSVVEPGKQAGMVLPAQLS
jgi:hypothetical protein